MSARKRVGVLISGRGSNLQALIDACVEPDFPAEIVTVISNRPDAYGLERARVAGIAAAVVDHKTYRSREDFDAALHALLEEAGCELICNAGFMRLLTEGFTEAWRDRQLNIHPSLLPAFRGLHPHERALEAGVRITGATVHFVRHEMDAGPIILQAAVPVLAGDTAETLAARVLEAEHIIYPRALALVAAGQAWVEGEIVRFASDNLALPTCLSAEQDNAASKDLSAESSKISDLLRGKLIKHVYRHRIGEILIEFDDDTRLFINVDSSDLDLSITGKIDN
jgi:phosphoribosylglycinamide formyltransferase-1